MSWSDKILPWLSSHAISLIILLILIILADLLYSWAFNRQTNLGGIARRLAQIQRPRPQPTQSEDR